jgi:hypothetical protein
MSLLRNLDARSSVAMPHELSVGVSENITDALFHAFCMWLTSTSICQFCMSDSYLFLEATTTKLRRDWTIIQDNNQPILAPLDISTSTCQFCMSDSFLFLEATTTKQQSTTWVTIMEVRKLQNCGDNGRGGRLPVAQTTAVDSRRFVSPIASQAQNNSTARKRRRVEEVDPLQIDLGLDDPNGLGNVIVPYDELLRFMTNNFVCKHCCKSNAQFERIQVGFATSINLMCACNATASLKAKVRSSGKNCEDFLTKWKKATTVTRYGSPFNAFDLNVRAVLSIQQFGGGERESAMLGGILDIAVDPLKNSWQKLESEVGTVQKDLGQKAIDLSIGYLQCFNSMFESLGLEMTPHTKEQCARWDTRRNYLVEYKKSAKYKEKMNKMKFEKLRVGKAKLAKDNAKALTYASGMAGPQVGPKMSRKKEMVCNTCKKGGHKMVTSKDCLMSTNPKSEHYKVRKRLECQQPLEGQCVRQTCVYVICFPPLTFPRVCVYVLFLPPQHFYVSISRRDGTWNFEYRRK